MGQHGVRPRVLLVDGLNVLRRAYEALPGGTGRSAQAAAAAEAHIRRACQHLSPTHVLCAFDGDPPTWRHEIYAEYKSHRPPTPAGVREAADHLTTLLSGNGLACHRRPHTEADDVIATLARVLAGRGIETLILSSDQGYSQLLGGPVRQVHPGSGEVRDAAWCRRRFGVAPAQYPDFLALAGSPSDNLPGAPGIGPKRAAALLQQYGDLESVLAAASGLGGRLGAALAAHPERLRCYRRVTVLRDDLSLDLNLRDLRRRVA